MSAKQLILLTPEFFTPDFMSQSQFADVSAKKVKCIEANERSPLLAPPTPEGLALLSSSVSRAKSGGLITPDSLAVVPFVQPVDHSLEQLLPFRQSLAPYGNIPRTSSYLSISHSQIPLGKLYSVALMCLFIKQLPWQASSGTLRTSARPRTSHRRRSSKRSGKSS